MAPNAVQTRSASRPVPGQGVLVHETVKLLGDLQAAGRDPLRHVLDPGPRAKGMALF